MPSSSSFSSSTCCNERDESFSEISSGPFAIAPKILVGISDIEFQKGKAMYRLEAIFIHQEQMYWSIWRRYSEFLKLRDELFVFFTKCYFNHCPGCHALYRALQRFDFPRKRFMTSNLKYALKRRRQALDAFTRLLSAHTFSSIPKCQLCSQEPFEKIKTFFFDPILVKTNSKKTLKEIEQEIQPHSFAPVNDPLKSKIEFRRGHYIFKIFQVEKPIFLTLEQEKSFFEKQKEEEEQEQEEQEVISAFPINEPYIESSLCLEEDQIQPLSQLEIQQQSWTKETSGGISNILHPWELAGRKHTPTNTKTTVSAS